MRWAMAPGGLPQAHCSKGLPQEDCSEGLPQADCFNALTTKADPHPTPCGPRPRRHFAHPKHPIPHTPLKSPASLNPAAANRLRQKAPWRATAPGRILRVDQLAPWHRHRCDPHGPVGTLAPASLRSAWTGWHPGAGIAAIRVGAGDWSLEPPKSCTVSVDKSVQSLYPSSPRS